MPSNQTPPASRDEWSRHIVKWRASKLTRAQYCEQHELKFNTFVYQNNRQQEALAKTITLVPVKIAVAATKSELVLRGANGWSLSMASDVSAAWLSELLGRLS